MLLKSRIKYILCCIGMCYGFWLYKSQNRVPIKTIPINTRPIRVNGLDDTVCKKHQQTGDTFYSSGTHFNPLNETYLNTSYVQILTHGMIRGFDINSKISTVRFEKKNALFRGMYSTNKRFVYLLTPEFDIKNPSRFLIMDKAFNVVDNIEAAGTFDGHDMVKYGDIVYVVSTGTGTLQVYNAFDFSLIRSHVIGTRWDHINTIAVSSSSVYVMFNKKNVEASEIIVYDRFSFDIFKRYKNIGWSAHGLSLWEDYIVSLDSLGGHVVLVDDSGEVKPVWTCKDNCFLKGLVVIDNTACFGKSPPQKRMLGRLTVQCDVICIDLSTNQAVQTKLKTNGLINQIVHPGNLVHFTPKLMKVKNKDLEGRRAPTYKMLGPIDIYDTRKFFLKHWDYLFGTERFEYDELFANYKAVALFPGVRHIRVIFSFSKTFKLSVNNDQSIELPIAWKVLKPVILPMLDSLFKRLKVPNWETKILRLQFNLIPPGAEVKPHVDMGFYATNAHRIHIPIFGTKCVKFMQRRNGWREVPFKEGEAFEINNRRQHRVQQHGPYPRVTFIIDYLDRPCSSYAVLHDDMKSMDETKYLDIHRWRNEL